MDRTQQLLFLRNSTTSAIYIAEKHGMKLYGYNAHDVGKYYGFKTMIREKFARVKVIIDFILDVKPRFLGERIEIK